MGNPNLFLLCIALFIVSIDCRTIPSAQSSPPRRNITIVCDPAKFANRGLELKDFAFCDKSLPYDVRAKDLIDRMTLQEKARQMGDKAYGVPRLGLPPYEWWSEALHGVCDGPGTRFDKDIVPGATSFPTPLLTTAAFNESLWKNIGQVVSTEARAMFNLGLAGLTFWSPNINIVRDPRWGRALETPGEDPYVVGRYAVNYVRGLQDVEGYVDFKDPNSRPLKIASCCKHFAAYDLESWLGVDRWHFDARVTEQDMVETFLRPFEMCVKDGDVSSVMCSFNKVNGVPVCADNRIMAEKFRGEWGLHGYIVSDCDSIDTILHGEHWLNDEPNDAVAQVLEAGLDLDCGTYYTNFAASAVEMGRVSEKEVDKALKNLYVVLMRLGFFDGSPGGYDSLGKEDVCSMEHKELAAQAAREGIVLLKNEGALPLDENTVKKLALVGPHANATRVMIGNYAGIPCRYVSPLEAFSSIATIDFQQGCEDVHCKTDKLIHPAVEAAKQADATIILAGLDLSVESEGTDRLDLYLPGYQPQFITEVADSASGPVVLVLFSGSAVDISSFKNNPKIAGIIWVGYPGEEGGQAIADVVFGHYNPGGRLPITWYNGDYVDQLPMTSMSLRPVDELGYPGRTYKFFNGSVVYPFGHGLSYTSFTYNVNSPLKPATFKLGSLQHCIAMNYTDNSIVRDCPAMRVDDLPCDSSIDFGVEVGNVGKKDGSHVVMVYAVAPSELEDAPIKQVVGFERVSVPPGGTATASFKLDTCKSLSVVTNSGYVALPSGVHTLVVGDGERSIPLSVQVTFDK